MGTRSAIHDPPRRRAARAALAAGAGLLLGGIVAAVVDPDRMAALEDPSPGAVLAGLATFAVCCAAPQFLFWLALRGGGRRALAATAVGAPTWALVFGVSPVAQVLATGLAGVSAVAVAAVALAAVADLLVTVAAVRGLRAPGTGCDVGAGGLSSAGAQRQHHPRTS